MTDQQIIEEFWARNESAITHVQAHYGKAGETVAHNLLQNSADAEECINDALLRLWNSIPPQRPLSLWAYFVKIIRNLALDRLRMQSASKRKGLTLVLEELPEKRITTLIFIWFRFYSFSFLLCLNLLQRPLWLKFRFLPPMSSSPV